MPAKRRPVNKTFSGCARCKSSKVKCDEAKPSCSRCTSRRLSCPGYPGLVIRWSTKHEVFSGAKAPNPSLAHNPFPTPVLDAFSSVQPISPSISPAILKTTPTAETTADLPQGYSNMTSPLFAKKYIELTEDEDIPTLACGSEVHEYPDKYSLTNSLDANSSIVAIGFRSPVQSLPDEMQCKDDNQWLPTNSIIPWKTSIPRSISHLPATLVAYYFQDVCSVFSSFDSELNPFRSYVSQVFPYSAPVFNAMLSSSAARLADERPQLKVIALQYQSQALRCISESLKQTNEVCEDTLFAIFLIGLSTAWHDGKDIGIPHFHAAQRAISSNSISARGSNRSMTNFFKSALTYWEMAISLVSDEVEFSFPLEVALGNSPTLPAREAREPGHLRIAPHPWTGVSSPIQAIFSRVTKVIRSLRLIDPHSDAGLLRCWKLGEDAKKLEEALWSVELPGIAEIDDSGDPNTPAYHHILLAEAYLFGGLYQIYRKFPGVLRRRREYVSSVGWPQLGLKNNPIIEWYNSLSNVTSDSQFLGSLGFSVLNRLQRIPITSGTRSVQAILIFVAAGSLAMPSPVVPEPDLPRDYVPPLEMALELDGHRIMDLREFTISRLESLRTIVHSRPVDLMLKVIKEMFRRLDIGEEIFWMDVMHEMKCETMLG